MLQTVIVILLILILIGSLPLYPYSASWGVYPSASALLVLIIVLLLIFARRP